MTMTVTQTVVFYVLLTVHLGSVLVNNQLHAQLFFFWYIFIPILYMYRAPLCSSSGESVVLIRHLAHVNYVGDLHLHSRHIPDVVLIQLILLMMSTGVLET